MEKFYLEIPSIERKNEIIDYINEFVLYPYDGLLTSVYWFNIDETINKYKDIFINNICINNNQIIK